MDSEQFRAPPTTTAALTAYYRRYGSNAAATDIELVHFQEAADIDRWLADWPTQGEPRAREALEAGVQPVIGFSFYTWNAAEFLHLAGALKQRLPALLSIAGGPHVQQAEDYLGSEPIDLVVLGEGEITLAELLDQPEPDNWPRIPGLAWLDSGVVQRSADRPRCTDLSRFPSPLDVLQLTDPDGQALYESISYETSRGCPFKCAFCEWGTGAIGGKMYQFPMAQIRRDWQAIAAAGIKDIWLADSNFGALKTDLEKAQIIVELKQQTGLPRSFATSWSKKHSRKVQEIALLLHRNQLLPHYQLALQTLTPEALRLSNRDNMSSNEYEPIAKQMSEQGVPIAAELIWGLPGDNLPDFERNLDTLLATFPNINIFGYTLLPGTEFYARRDEYRIEAIPVAGYGKAKGEYVVGCHSFSRDEGEEGYFLITAHILLIHGHIMPLLTRYLALQGEVPVSPLLRTLLRALLATYAGDIHDLDPGDRMAVYERRNELYLHALARRERSYQVLAEAMAGFCRDHGAEPTVALRLLQLDAALCPRTGEERRISADFDFDAAAVERHLAAMELPEPRLLTGGSARAPIIVHHPGGVGEILHDADGGSWLKGSIEPFSEAANPSSDTEYVAIA
jgi:hypothetical protein